MQKVFEDYTDRKSAGYIWGVKLELAEKWLYIKINEK